MGLKKNSPGCNCCDPGPCLNEDTTLYTGIEITGLPSWSVTLGSATATITDYNGTYLWGAVATQFGCFTRPPASWRLGSFITAGTYCCNLRWSVTGSIQSADTGLGFPCLTGSPGFATSDEVDGILFWKPSIEINFTVGTTSISATIKQQLDVWVEQELPLDSNVAFGLTRYISQSTVSGQTGTGRNARQTTDTIKNFPSSFGFNANFAGDGSITGLSTNSGGFVTPISMSNASSPYDFPHTYITRQPVSGASEVINSTSDTIPSSGTATLTVI